MDALLTYTGLFGVALVLLGYGLLSTGKLNSGQARYQALNVLAATCILLSLIPQWNLASFLLNVAWVSIGLFALVRMAVKRKRV